MSRLSKIIFVYTSTATNSYNSFYCKKYDIEKKAIVCHRLLHTSVFTWLSSHLQQHDACHDSCRCGEVSFLPKLQSLSLSQSLCSPFPLVHYCITRWLSTLFANSRFIVGTTYEYLQQNDNWTKFKKEKRHVTTVRSTVD